MEKRNSQVEKVTFDLALYVGSYVTDYLDEKDVNEGHKKKQYGRFGKGIGEAWIRKYWKEVLAVGSVKTFEEILESQDTLLQKLKSGTQTSIKNGQKKNV